MNRISRQLAAIVLGSLSMAAVHASDATEFPLPGPSTLTRADVQAEARRALAAGELRHDESSQRVAAPAASLLTRAEVRAEAARVGSQPSRGERRMASLDHIGGM